MDDTLTIKKDNKRIVKSLNIWFGLNSTTPERWFERWVLFIEELMQEVNFRLISTESISKPKDQKWTQDIYFRHETLGDYLISLQRNRYQEGGEIFIYTDYGCTSIDVINRNLCDYAVSSRQEVGDHILEYIRSNWELEKNDSKTNKEG